MKNMVTTEEALKELISRVPDEVLSEAIGGMSASSRDRLIKLGLVAAVAAAGSVDIVGTIAVMQEKVNRQNILARYRKVAQ